MCSSGFRFQYPRHFVGGGGGSVFLEIAGHDKDGIAHADFRHAVGAAGGAGVVLLSSFSCGPDSMTDEILTRRLKNIPILSMTLDGQDATAGMETRIESFIDILHLRKDGTVCL